MKYFFLKTVVHLTDAVFELDAGFPAELGQARYIHKFLVGAVGFVAVPTQTALKTDHFLHHLGQFGNRQIGARADVDVGVAHFFEAPLLYNVAETDVLHHKNYRFGQIVAVQKLATGGAASPEPDVHLQVFVGINAKGLELLGQLLFAGGRGQTFEGALLQIQTNAVPVLLHDEFAQVHFANERGQYVRIIQVVVVVGPIQVGGHHRNKIGIVLQVVGLTHLHAGNFGNGVGLIGVFEGTGQQGFFGHGLGTFLGIDARAAQKQKLLHPAFPGRMNDVVLNLQVLIKKVGPISIVGHDAANLGGGQKDKFRLFFFEPGGNSSLIEQIELLTVGRQQVLITLAVQMAVNGRTYESFVAGNKYPAGLVHCIWDLLKIIHYLVTAVLQIAVLLHQLEVRSHHVFDQGLQVVLRLPTQLFFGLGGVADEQFHFGGTEIAGIDLYHALVLQVRVFGIADTHYPALLVHAFAAEFHFATQPGKGHADKLADFGGDAGGHHVVFGLILLQNQVHGFHIVLGVAPVALGRQVAQIQFLLHAQRNARYGTGNFAGYESLAPDGRFVVKKDAVAGVDVVGLPVINGNPVTIKLGYGIGRARIEGRGLALWNFLHQAVQLAGRSLVKAGLLGEPQKTNGL